MKQIIVTRLFPFLFTAACIFGCFILGYSEDTLMQKAPKDEKAPSKEQIMWTETELGYGLSLEYGYAGSGGLTDAHNVVLQQQFTSRALMAFLFHGGVGWEKIAFTPPDHQAIPSQLDTINFLTATDFRWSEKDMLRLQLAPGFYSDLSPLSTNDFNVPFAIAYTRISSRNFQWTVALSVDGWREDRLLPAGGFRWQINDRWKLKFILPKPMLEYKVEDNFRVSMGADFRGGTFRVGNRTAERAGDPRLYNALVEYREIRVGPGFSWNIRPLLALQGDAGVIMDRSWNYHNNNVRIVDGKAPYVTLALRWYFQINQDPRSIRDQLRSMEVTYPVIQKFLH